MSEDKRKHPELGKDGIPIYKDCANGTCNCKPDQQPNDVCGDCGCELNDSTGSVECNGIYCLKCRPISQPNDVEAIPRATIVTYDDNMNHSEEKLFSEVYVTRLQEKIAELEERVESWKHGKGIMRMRKNEAQKAQYEAETKLTDTESKLKEAVEFLEEYVEKVGVLAFGDIDMTTERHQQAKVFLANIRKESKDADKS